MYKIKTITFTEKELNRTETRDYDIHNLIGDLMRHLSKKGLVSDYVARSYKVFKDYCLEVITYDEKYNQIEIVTIEHFINKDNIIEYTINVRKWYTINVRKWYV